MQADLDAKKSLRGKYIMFDRIDVHCVWVSASVLNLLPDLPPEVPGGEIVTDPGRGVFCDNAMDLVTALWPKPNATQKAAYVTHAMRELNKVGLVGVHDAGVTPENLQLYTDLASTKNWTVRVYAMAQCTQRNSFCPDAVARLSRDDGLLSIQSVKLFAGMRLSFPKYEAFL